MQATRRMPAIFTAAIMGATPVAATAMENVGMASWYGGRHNGLRTSNGETFNENAMTAASSVLPLGSLVRVTMHENGNSVVVRVTDRMGGRSSIIDLSKGAAQQIGLLGRGRSMVSVTSTNDAPVEVAEASDDDLADSAIDAPRGRPRRHHGARLVSAARQCCRVPSVILARHSVQRRAVRRTL